MSDPPAHRDPPATEVEFCTEHHDPDSHPPVQPALLSVEEAQQMGAFFAVLADPTRLRLISLLASDEYCVCDLAAQLDVSESAVSHQLRALRAARLVRYRKEGRQVFYRLHDHHVLALYRATHEHLEE